MRVRQVRGIVSLSMFIVLGLLITGVFTPAIGQQQPIISDVVIEGNANVDEPLIRSVTTFKKGNLFNPRDGATTIKQLYRLGLFEDVRVYGQLRGNDITVIINVKEYPLMDRIDFNGNKKIKDKDLKKISGIYQGQAVSPFRKKSVEERIIKAYNKKGYLLAKTDMRILVERNNAIIEVNINEGKKVELGEVFVENNTSIPDEKLQKAFKKKAQTEDEHFWKEGDLRRDRLLDQFEKLSKEYRKFGYRDARVVGDTLWFSEDKERMYLKVIVDEGRRYFLGDVAFEGNTKFTDEQLGSLIKINSGDPLDEEKYQDGISKIYEAYGELGYLYATPIAQEIAANDSVINLQFAVNEGEPAKVHRINIIGNTKTKDKVVRRELVVKPGQTFRRSSLLRSQREIFQLNFFQDVQPDLIPLPNGDVDVTFTVLEKPTGTANAGAGFSGLDGLIGTISVVVPNFLGNGQNLNFAWEFGARRNSISAGFIEPWLFDTPTSAGFDVFRTNRRWFNEYNAIQKGFGVSLGRRFRGTYWRVNGAYRLFDLRYTGFADSYFEAKKVEINTQAALDLANNPLETAAINAARDRDIQTVDSNIKRREDFEGNSGLTSQVSFSITRDSRDFPQFATSGMRHSVQNDFAGVGGDVRYFKQVYSSDIYVPVLWTTALSLRGKYGFIVNPFSSKEAPAFERFYPGGISFDGMIRGYGNNSIGPYKDGLLDGGRAMTILTMEYQIPILDQRSSPQPVYAIAFAEAGNAWAKVGQSSFDPRKLKKSVGFGIRVIMPLVGLLGFDFGYGFDPPSNPVLSGLVKRSGWNTHFQLGQVF